MEKTYYDLFEVELNQMIDKVNNTSAKARQGESWRLINEISGRKAGKKRILEGATTSVTYWGKCLL